MGYLEDQILQLPLSTALNSSGSLRDGGESPYLVGKHFQNEVTGSLITCLFMLAVKTGPSICVCSP